MKLNGPDQLLATDESLLATSNSAFNPKVNHDETADEEIDDEKDTPVGKDITPTDESDKEWSDTSDA